MLYRFVYHILLPLGIMPLFRLFNRLVITGRENIPEQGSVVIIANHISSWDSVLLYSIIRREAYFMAKVELFQIPLLGPFLRRIHVFPVKRDTVDRTALRTAAKVLEDGHVLAIFPEGHRSKTGELLPFKPGAALFAHRAQAPVIPVLFENTPKAFPKSIWQKVRVSVGEPLDLSSFYSQKANSALLGEMTDVLRQGIVQLKPGADAVQSDTIAEHVGAEQMNVEQPNAL